MCSKEPHKTPHDPIADPSPWVCRFAPYVLEGGRVLDLAAGGGRHSKLFLEHGHGVTALDREVDRLVRLRDDLAVGVRLEILQADLEDGRPYPLAGRQFDLIIVTNYLYRPLLPALIAGLTEGGLMIYETFAQGNERFGKPSNPDFLLAPGELLEAVRGRLRVLAYEDLVLEDPRPAAVQRIAAIRET